MNITRNTRRADGLTVGEALDRDAAFLRSQGFDAPDGAKPYPQQLDEFKERARQVVLDALDGLAHELMGNCIHGPKDRELPELFAGIDPIASRMFDKSRGL